MEVFKTTVQFVLECYIAYQVGAFVAGLLDELKTRNSIELGKLNEWRDLNKWRKSKIPTLPQKSANNVRRVIGQARDHAMRMNQ